MPAEEKVLEHPEEILELSDEEIMEMPEPSSLIGAPQASLDGEESGNDNDDDAGNEDEDDDDDGNNGQPQDSGQSGEDEDDDEDDTEGGSEETDEAETEGQESEDPESSNKDGDPFETDVAAKKGEPKKKGAKKKAKTDKSIEEAADIPAEIDYEAEYKKLIAPFRANGADIQINNVEDAIHLMQMGANYNKKMRGLKPNMKLLKMLENNKLLDESKLSHLIDISKQDPGAVMKMVKDSGLDPLEMDLEKTDEYRPNTYTVDDNEVELDSVLQDIQETPSFQETIDIISNKWDDSSKKILLGNPALIHSINDQVGSGIYGQIDSVMQREKLLGRLTGMSDLEAYKAVGDAMQAQGAFNAPAGQQQQAAPGANAQPITKPKAKIDPKLKSRKRAAASTKSAPSKKSQPDFNPLDLSDEEFAKMAAPI